MKLKWWRLFSSDMDLKAFGGTPLRPGDLSLVSSCMARMYYVHKGGSSSSPMTSFKFISFITVVSVVLLLLSTFLKWFANALTFSLLFYARFPEGSLICITLGEVQWLDSPPVSLPMLTQASFGLKCMLWIYSARWQDHPVFATLTASSNFYSSVLRWRNVLDDRVLFSARIACRTEFLVSRVGVRVSWLKWYQLWSSLLFFISGSSPLRRMALLKSV